MTAYEMRISDWSSDVCSSDLRISWIVVAYLVATTVAAPVYGQLGDLLGRRLLLVIALVVFMTASLLCALSTSIEMLTAMRILQGLGGGGLMTLSQALVGEAVPPRERAHYQGRSEEHTSELQSLMRISYAV